jgi:hypothetical protein
MDYSYNAPSTGSYNVRFESCYGHVGAQLQIRKADGTILSTVNFPNTGVGRRGKHNHFNQLSAGASKPLRIISTSAATGTLNWLELN